MNIYLIDDTMSITDKCIENADEYETRGKALYELLIETNKFNIIAYEEVFKGQVENGDLIEIEQESVVFIHSGTQRRFLDFANRYKDSCYFVCYSGGNIPKYVESLIIEHPTRFIFNSMPPSSKQKDISKKWNIPLFIEAASGNKADCLKYLEKEGKPYLSALSILCIGFRAQHGDLAELQCGINLSSPGLNSTATWKNVLGDSVANVVKKLEGETDEISALIVRVCGENTNDLKLDDLPLVKAAYESIPRCLVF